MEFKSLLSFAVGSVCRESLWAQMQAGVSRKALGCLSLVPLEIFSGLLHIEALAAGGCPDAPSQAWLSQLCPVCFGISGHRAVPP